VGDGAVLVARAVCKSYASPAGDLDVLKQVSLAVDAGEFVSIVGESGSGKSTLLQILGALDQADGGEVCLQKQAFEGLSDEARATIRNWHIGFVYQEHHLIPELTALENVALPLLIRGVSQGEAQARAWDVLHRLHMEHRAEHVPSRLSGGESQRVAVARALVGKPSLLLADEPTGNLDEHSAQVVFSALQSLAKEEGAAVVMVTHSQHLAQQGDRILRLQHGCLLQA